MTFLFLYINKNEQFMKKLKDDKDRRIRLSITIAPEINKLIEENTTNKSKYIEKLIREDMISRGYEIKNKFEK